MAAPPATSKARFSTWRATAMSIAEAHPALGTFVDAALLSGVSSTLKAAEAAVRVGMSGIGGGIPLAPSPLVRGFIATNGPLEEPNETLLAV